MKNLEIVPVHELKHVINCKDAEGNDMKIKIRLSDDCKNGHNDFAITCDIWQAGKPHNDKYFIMGGCCHEEIIKVRPDLKIFVDLHLSDVNGAPTYAIENGYYHLHNSAEKIAKEYLRINYGELKLLKSAPDKLYFTYLLDDFRIIERWKSEANGAIELLEKMTGNKFQDNSLKLQKVKINEKDKAIIVDRLNNGYYEQAQIQERATEAQRVAKNEIIAELKNDLEKDLQKHKDEFNVKMEVVRCGLSLDNFIFYNHTHEAVFNWRDYGKQITIEEFKQFIKDVNYKKLPKEIKFKMGKV